MTNQEILIKAIEKAIAGGWTADGMTELGYATKAIVDSWLASYTQEPEHELWHMWIFNHDFAKSLWPAEYHKFGATDFCKMCHANGECCLQSCWQEHLQNMVVEKDPIDYLGKHI